MRAYLTRHLQVLFATLGGLRRAPLTSITTILIIGISLLLPVLLYITLQSGAELTRNWQGQPQFSVFLQQDLANDEAQLIFEELRLHPAVSLAEFISPTQALEEFKSLSGLDFELGFLGENPLPASVVVLPGESHYASSELDSLREELSKIDGIEEIRLDLEWTDRFNAILTSLSKAAQVLSLLLLAALLLIIGNTIKLLITNRHQEIVITKLVGGSNRFVRRPFLYFGTLFGLFGAVVTLALLALVNYLMTEPLLELANLYQRDSLIYQLQWHEIGLIVVLGALLGWLAARLSVAQHLGKIRPK